MLRLCSQLRRLRYPNMHRREHGLVKWRLLRSLPCSTFADSPSPRWKMHFSQAQGRCQPAAGSSASTAAPLMFKEAMQRCLEIVEVACPCQGSPVWARKPHGTLTMFSPNSSRSTLLMATM